jgi:hypothetical protein
MTDSDRFSTREVDFGAVFVTGRWKHCVKPVNNQPLIISFYWLNWSSYQTGEVIDYWS